MQGSSAELGRVHRAKDILFLLFFLMGLFMRRLWGGGFVVVVVVGDAVGVGEGAL